MARKPSLSILQIEEQEAAPKQNKRDQPKEFTISREPNGLYCLKYTAGGELPNRLKGFYTTSVKAEAAAADYLRERNAASAS